MITYSMSPEIGRALEPLKASWTLSACSAFRKFEPRERQDLQGLLYKPC